MGKKNQWHSCRRTKWRNLELVHEYKKIRNELRKLIRKKLSSYELDISKDKKNPRRLFAYVNSKQRTKLGVSAILDKMGETHTEGRQVANVLNDKFGSVFTQDLDESPLPGFENQFFEMPLDLIQISEYKVFKQLEKLDRHKSPGVYGVSPFVLRECAKAFSIPLALLFNMSLSDSELPSAWREANVTPLYKKVADSIQ